MPTDLIAGLKALRLFGMADALHDMAEQASPRYQHALPILEGLLQAEKADREVRTLKYQLKSAKFPVYRDLVSFDFAQNPGLRATRLATKALDNAALSSWRFLMI